MTDHEHDRRAGDIPAWVKSAFAGVAAFVGVLVLANTLIIIAQVHDTAHRIERQQADLVGTVKARNELSRAIAIKVGVSPERVRQILDHDPMNQP